MKIYPKICQIKVQQFKFSKSSANDTIPCTKVSQCVKQIVILVLGEGGHVAWYVNVKLQGERQVLGRLLVERL